MYKQLLIKNLDGCIVFIKALIHHQGVLNVHRLHKIVNNNDILSVALAETDEKFNDFSIGIGGEVSNSFCTVYEVAYLFQALFLSAIGTLAISKGNVERYRKLNPASLDSIIKADLLKFGNNEIFRCLRNPKIAIVSSLDTDIEPVRYNKHQLWNLNRHSLYRRVDSINVTARKKKPENISSGVYWTKADFTIAQKSTTGGSSLIHAKAKQMYLVYSIACEKLGIDLHNIPLYFNFVPRQEIIDNGPDNSYLKLLVALHCKEFVKEFKNRTGINHPWFIAHSCPNCGVGSKRIISAHLLSNAKTVRCICKKQSSRFRDEQGNTIELAGCGHRWDITIPEDPVKIWKLIRDQDITIHFSIRWLICLLKDTVDTPIGYVLTDIGILRDKNGHLAINNNTVTGYGDHRRMLTSALEIQDWLINGESKIGEYLKHKKLLMPQPLLLFGYDAPTKLVDREMPVHDADLFASDTSFLKFLNPHDINEIFNNSIRLHHYSLSALRKLKSYESQQT